MQRKLYYEMNQNTYTTRNIQIQDTYLVMNTIKITNLI